MHNLSAISKRVSAKNCHMRFVLAIVGLMIISFIHFAHADTITLTPFDISFSEKDFTKTGPSHHQILVIKPNQTTSVSIKVGNHDTIEEEISFSVLTANLENFPFSYSFEPQTVIVAPKSEKEIFMHIQTKDTNSTTWGIIPILAQSKSFGMIGKSFYLIIGNNVTESDMYLIDVSLREGLPGPAFPNLYKDFRTQPPELQKVLDRITANKFGVPRYLPSGYSFQGLTNPDSHLGFVYASTKVTNATESIDFLRSGGLLIGYEINNSNFNFTEWLPLYVAQNEAQEIIVNDLRGTATPQQERVTTEGQKYKFPAQIVLFDKYSEVYLNGNMPLDELLKVAASIPLPTGNPPIIISQVELWGPTSFYTDGIKLCGYNETSLGPWAPAWIELHNTKNEIMTIDRYELTITKGGVGSYELPIKLGPNEYCYIQTAGSFNTRVGVGGGLGNDAPPHQDSAIILGYSIQTYKGDISYQDSTPEFSDNFVDKRTWQLVDGKWIFKEADLKHEFPFRPIPISPVRQFNWGVTVKDIQCKEGLLVFVKTKGSPLCLTPFTASILEKRGWGTPEKTIQIQKTAFMASYHIFGGTLDQIVPDLGTRGLALSLKTTNDGKITLFLPRSFVDTPQIGDYTGFNITTDGKKVDYYQHLTPTDRMFVISFKKGVENIEIIPQS